MYSFNIRKLVVALTVCVMCAVCFAVQQANSTGDSAASMVASMGASVAQAKSKAALKLDYKVDTLCRYQRTNAAYAIRNYHYKAKYRYSSSNKKVASVTKKGVIRAKQGGKTKITIRERYKGKTKKAILTVRVLKARVSKITAEIGRVKKTSDEYLYDLNTVENDPILDASPKATYTFASKDTSILKVTEDGRVVEALKFGTVHVEVTEHYKKHAEVIGSFPVKIIPPSFEKNGKTIKLKWHGKFDPNSDYTDDYYELIDDLNDWTQVTVVICNSKEEVDEYKADPQKVVDEEEGLNDDPVLRFDIENKEWTGQLNAAGPGTRYVAICEEFDDQPVIFVGYCKIIVSKAKGAKK